MKLPNPNRKCPKCGAWGVHRSHRHGPLERVLHWFGADVRRCPDCRARGAWYGALVFPLPREGVVANWSGIAVMGSGFLVCIVLVWWVVERLSDLAG